MDADTVDTHLTDAVREAPTPEARAALLGIDYAQLMRTARRLKRWSYGVVGVAGLATLVPLMVSGAMSRWEDQRFVAMGAGAVVVVLFVGAAMVIAQLGAVALSRPLGRQRAGLAGLAMLSVLVVVALYLGGAVTAGTPLGSGILLGAAVAPVIFLSGVLSLPVAFTRNHPRLVQAVHDQQAEPAWQSLLGGHVRWMVSALVASIVCAVATVVLFTHAPLALVPAVLLAVGTDVAAYAVGRRGSATGWFAIQAATAVILVTAAIVVSA